MNDLFVKPSDLAPLTKARSVDINNLTAAIASAFEKVPSTAGGFSALANFAPDVSLVANTVKFSISANVAALVDGMQFRVKLANGLNGTAVATVTGLGTFPVRRPDGSNPAGEYVAGQVVNLTYLAAGGGSFQLPAQALAVTAGAGLPLTGGTMTGALNRAKGASVASAAVLDLQNATGNVVHVTGTAVVTSINLAAGADRECIADAAFTLTHSAALKLPGAANIVAAVGDTFTAVGDGSGNVIVTKYTRADGLSTRPMGTIPIGAMLAFDSDVQANVVTKNGDTYLKTGVIADATPYPLAVAGPYATGTSTLAPVLTPANGGAGMVCNTATGNGIIVAALSNGWVSASKDGSEWTAGYQIGVANNNAQIAFANGFFIYACPNGLYRSADAQVWSRVLTLGGITNCVGVAYGAGLWVAIYSGVATYYTSVDGITWTPRTLPSTVTSQSTAAPYNGGLIYGSMFLAIGTTVNALSSTDGLNWTARTLPAANATGMCYGNSTYVITYNSTSSVTTIYSSTDTITWTSRGTSQGVNTVFGVNFLGGRFIIQDATGIFSYSANGTAWSTVTGQALCAIGASGMSPDGTYAVGFLISGSGAATWRLTNNTNSWLQNAGAANSSAYSMEWANDRFVMCGLNGTQVLDMSWDGKSWWRSLTPAGVTADFWIVYFAGKYNLFTASAWMTSTDCLVWTTVATNLPPYFPSNSSGVFIVNGRLYLIPGGGALAYTTDGITWTIGSFPIGGARYMAYGNGTYVLLGGSVLLTSADGITFTSRSNSAFGGPPVGLAFAGGFFITATYYGLVFKSADGINWTAMANYQYGYLPTYFTAILTDGTTVVMTNNQDASLVLWNGAAGDPLYRRGISRPIYGQFVTIGSNAVRCNPAGRFTGKGANTSYSYGDILWGNKVCNDINYKTYDAAGVARTDFYKRVA